MCAEKGEICYMDCCILTFLNFPGGGGNYLSFLRLSPIFPAGLRILLPVHSFAVLIKHKTSYHYLNPTTFFANRQSLLERVCDPLRVSNDPQSHRNRTMEFCQHFFSRTQSGASCIGGLLLIFSEVKHSHLIITFKSLNSFYERLRAFQF